jgi:hypothetical protein
MDSHEDLLETWSLEPHHQGQCFIKDGIIDNGRWRSVDLKVLLLLKEGRDSGSSRTWDLRKYVRESDPNPGTLRNAAYWCYAIQHIKRGTLPGLPLASERTAEYRKAVEALRSSAIVNIKKSNGQSSSSPDDIASYAMRDKKLIQRQIQLIAPKIIICGYTWRFVEDWWPGKVRLHDGVWQVGQRVFIDFWHPSFPVSEDLKYYALAGLIHFSNALESVGVGAVA